MTAPRATAAVTPTTALAALTTARTAKAPANDDSAFGDKLTEAQQPAKNRSSTPVRDQHQDAQNQQQQQPAERDVPRHPVLHGRSGPVATGRTVTSVVRKPVVLHPMTAADVEAAAARQSPATVAPPQQVQLKTAAATTSTATVAPAAAPGSPARAASTAPATTALVAGTPSAPGAPDGQQPASDAAAATASTQPTSGSTSGLPAGQAASPSSLTITVTTPLSSTAASPSVPQAPAEAQAQAPAAVAPAPVQPTDPTAATPPPAQVSADASAIAQPTSQHHAGQAQPVAAQPTAQPAATVIAAAAERETADQGPSQPPGHDSAPASHGRPTTTTDATPVGTPATPYSSLADRTQLGSTPAGAPTDARTPQEVPATQALPAGTLDQVNAAEHSVRVQMETQTLGKLTAEMHTRPGEIGVHLSVPDDAGRALMAQRLDALRDSLGQGGSAVHLSLAAQGNFPQGQQSSTPREDRASAQSAPQPHDAATPRATDGSPMTPATADGTRLVDVHA